MITRAAPEAKHWSAGSLGSRQQAWYLVSSHGALVFWIAANPGCTVAEAADGLCLSRRTIWALIGDLRRAGMLHVRKEGRHHRYRVNMDAPLRHPVLRNFTLSAIVGRLNGNGHDH